MIIDETKLSDFLDNALPSCSTLETVDFPCPRCGTRVRFPTIARRQDIDAFRKLLETAHKYLGEDLGMTEKILKELMNRIRGQMLT